MSRSTTQRTSFKDTNQAAAVQEEEEVLEDKDFAPDFENAFHDLSSRSAIFRTKLIEEFQLLENLGVSTTVSLPPQYNTCDVRDEKAFNKMLHEAPCQLIKFQTLKRTQGNADVDRRLNRIRNKDKVPIGAWAAWVLESKPWEYLIIFFIVLNAILVGVVAELSDQESQYLELFFGITILDNISLFIFYIEIALHFLDNFYEYWKNPWNLFDFLVTVATTVPEVLHLINGGDSSSNSLNLVFRQLRTFRIIRILKLAVRFRGLRIIVVTIIEAFKSMALILLLLLMITFIFAIVGMSSFTPMLSYPSELRYKYSFSNLYNSFESLFQVLTLDNWQDMMNDLLVVLDPVLVYTFILAWVWIGAFIFKNLFVGVMVSNFDRISVELKKKEFAAAQAKKLEKMKRRLKKELAVVNSAINQTGTNTETPGKPPTPEKAILQSRMSMQTDSNVQFPPGGDPNPSTVHMMQEEVRDLLARSRGISKGWEKLIRETLVALTERTEETLWPRDTLFRYFQLMETLQENMREYQELQFMATTILLEMHDV